MNYRHSYHAGSFADVFKHSILTLLVNSLLQKEKGFCVIDTHAGVGAYSLLAEQAQKTKEADEGIVKLLQQPTFPAELLPYLNIVANVNACSLTSLKNQLLIYPGSPSIIQALLREQDKLIVNELHPDDFAQLKRMFYHDKRVACHQRNAYELLPAILPPVLPRGLILIDPPFEKKNEFVELQRVIEKSLQRFSHGIYAIWYPITDLSHRQFYQRLAKKIDKTVLLAELTLKDYIDGESGLVGTGMIIINPPWQIKGSIQRLLAFLHPIFSHQVRGQYLVKDLHN